jgi:predicted GNAT family acetyltransferase
VPIRIVYTTDPAHVVAEAQEFLALEPVRNNVVLTQLHARISCPEPGNYWIAREGDRLVGLALQSPPSRPVIVTSMPRDVLAAMVDAIFEATPSLPGVTGDAAVAAQFAGWWTERTRSPAVPFQGMRLYEVDEVARTRPSSGRLRLAHANERDVLVAWMRAFQVDTGEHGFEAARLVDQRLAGGHFFVWEDDRPVSMAGHSPPVAGVVRLSFVYTPPEKRGRGYAHACVGELSAEMRSRGHRCVLFADLGNPLSNAMYRRLGYRAVEEIVRYRFDPLSDERRPRL